MVVQPTGTVTLLFTDVEGSTLLLERLGAERFAEALATHRRVLREAFARHGGYEVDEEGDAFLVAFPAAGEAVAAAREAQQGLRIASVCASLSLRGIALSVLAIFGGSDPNCAGS
jgi:class 3 adenylate cyclase